MNNKEKSKETATGFHKTVNGKNYIETHKDLIS